jgi:hypothetical protein
MSATQGIMQIGDYTTPATDPLRVQALINLIPNPDYTTSSGSVAVPPQAVTNTYLDEMSPACAAQLLVELTALHSKVT